MDRGTSQGVAAVDLASESVGTEWWLRPLLDANLGGLFLLDADHQICECNPAAVAMFGCSRADALGTSIYDLFVPAAHAKLRREIETAPGSGVIRHHVELEGINPLTEEVLIDLRCVEAGDGSPGGYVIFLTDVTATMMAHAQEARRSLLQSAVMEVNSILMSGENLKDAIEVALGSCGGIMEVAHAFHFRGPPSMESAELSARGVSSVHPSESWRSDEVDSAEEGLRSVAWGKMGGFLSQLAQGQSVVIDDVQELPLTEAKLLSVHGIQAVLLVPVLVQGRFDSFLAFDEVRGPRRWLEDEAGLMRSLAQAMAMVFERAQGERELRHATSQLRIALTRAEDANKAKSEFLANVSHEIRTPMTAIVGYSDLMRRPGVTTEQSEQWSTLICKNANFLLGLINDILDLSKIEAGEMDLELSEADPADVIETAVGSVLALATERNLTLSVRYRTPVPSLVRIDPVRLRQILVNLVSNGLKFTTEGGVVVSVDFMERSGQTRMQLEVRDTGIGIAESKISQLFAKFTQVHGSQKKYGGTGLGLAISRRFARMMEGDISVQSKVGEGTTFTVDIPVEHVVKVREMFFGVRHDQNQGGAPEAQKDALAENQEEADADLTHKRVLLVDDNRDNREIFQFILKDAGVDVTLATNGQEAFDEVLEARDGGQPFDVVLMDMNMPIKDGYTATRELREEGVRSPILALTAFAMADDANDCLGAGCDAYLTKPIRAEDLLSAVQEWSRKGEVYTGGAEAAAPAKADEEAAPAADHEGEGLLESELPDRPEMRALLATFRESMGRSLGELQTAFEAADRETLRSMTHSIKGSAGCYGFPQVSVVAGCCETALREGESIEQVADVVDQLVRLMRRVAGT